MILFQIILIAAAGWLVGSGLNYLADVLPRTRSFSKVSCIHCSSAFRIVDFILLKKCNKCGARRNGRAYIVQILAAICLIVVWFVPPERFGFWLTMPYFLYFAVVFIIDVEHRVILHEVSLVGGLLAIPLGIIWNGWMMTILGGGAGFAIMFILYYFGILFNRVIARQRGIVIDEVALGFGDVNLSGVLGLLLGWPKIGISLFFSVVLGGVASGVFLLVTALSRKYRPFTAIPYAPFLIIAAVILIYAA